jgi:hypothetical protein
LPWDWQTQLYMNMNDITLQTHCYLIAGERNNYYLQFHIAQKQKPYLDICPIWQTHYPSHARLRSLVPWKLQRSSTCKHVQSHLAYFTCHAFAISSQRDQFCTNRIQDRWRGQ